MGSGLLFSQENPLWLRYPAISPDGKTILFSYQGDLWSVPATGGTATPLTMTESYEYMPVWSHDGKRVAFASDRNGNDVIFSAYRQDLVTNAQFPMGLMSELYAAPVTGGRVVQLLPSPAWNVCPTTTIRCSTPTTMLFTTSVNREDASMFLKAPSPIRRNRLP